MNTDKTLNDKFINNSKKDYPIWYYKELLEVPVDYVIAYLLKESFVVEIDGNKHEVIFGFNEKENYVGQYIRPDDIKNPKLSSYEVINKGFKEGKWFIINKDRDTSDEFKDNYRKRKEEYKHKELEIMYRGILNNAIRSKDLTKEQQDRFLKELENSSFEDVKELINILCKNTN